MLLAERVPDMGVHDLAALALEDDGRVLRGLV